VIEPIAISGVGLITPMGEGAPALAALARAVAPAPFGPAAVPGFPVEPAGTPDPVGARVGTIRDVDPEPYLRDRKAMKYMDRMSRMAVRASGLALADAGVALDGVDPYAVGLAMAVDLVSAELADFQPVLDVGRAPDGSFDAAAVGRGTRINPLAVFKTLSNIPVCNVSIGLGIKGDNVILYHDAVQAARAIEEGSWAIREDAARLVLSGAVSQGVSFLGLHTEAMKRGGAGGGGAAHPPLVEAAVVLVLERTADVQARGGRVRGRVLAIAGAGASGRLDAASPDAETFRAAMEAALAAAPGARFGDVRLVVGGGVTSEAIAAERAAIAWLARAADAPEPESVHPWSTVGDMRTARLPFGVALALDRLAGAAAAAPARAPSLALVNATGAQGDVACVLVEVGDAPPFATGGPA
jgi:3-oxoacyl-(acyl-carrier-protein) synthase